MPLISEDAEGGVGSGDNQCFPSLRALVEGRVWNPDQSQGREEFIRFRLSET